MDIYDPTATQFEDDDDDFDDLDDDDDARTN